MSKINVVIQELIQTKDELSLKAHLFEMEIKTEWDGLCRKLRKLESELEHDLITLSQKIGQAEETSVVGSEQEIQSLLTEFKDLRNKSKT